MRQVVFDSSFLMAVAEAPTTWLDDTTGIVGKFEPVLLDCVRAEMLKLAAEGSKRSRFARAGLQMASGFRVLPCGKAQVDDEIVSVALSNGAVVATVDGALIAALRGAGVSVISLKSGRVGLV